MYKYLLLIIIAFDVFITHSALAVNFSRKASLKDLGITSKDRKIIKRYIKAVSDEDNILLGYETTGLSVNIEVFNNFSKKVVLVHCKDPIDLGSQKLIYLTLDYTHKRLLVRVENTSEKELSILKCLHANDGIISISYIISSEHSTALFCPYYRFNLDIFVSKFKPSYKTKLLIAYKLIKALDFMHRNKILHRDIKPLNILVSLNPLDVVLIDFGLSMHEEDLEARKSNVGTLIFNSPRLWQSQQGLDDDNKLFNQDDDLWALGLSLFYLHYGSLPSWCDALGNIFTLKEEDIDTLEEFHNKDSDLLGDIIYHFLKITSYNKWSLSMAEMLLFNMLYKKKITRVFPSLA
jgi:serine/threonine protein kinase